MQDDNTDTEQHDSLPDDVVSVKEAKPQSAFNFKGMVNLARKSSDNRKSSDIEPKHVHIVDCAQLPKRSDSYQEQRRDNWRERRRRQSPTKSTSSSKETKKEDSVNSTWSEAIPVITISKTESAECILEGTSKKAVDEERAQGVSSTYSSVSNQEDETPLPEKSEDNVKSSDSTDTLIADEETNFKPRIKYVLLKQMTVIERDDADAYQQDRKITPPGTEPRKPITEDTSYRWKEEDTSIHTRSTGSKTSDTVKTE